MIDIYLGRSEGGVARDGEPPFWLAYADWRAGVEALFKHASEAVARPWWRAKRPARVWLSGGLARPFLCGPLAGLKRWHEVTAFAQAAASDATGLASPCHVEVQEWPHPHAALAVAINVDTAATVHAAGRAHGIAVQTLRPWWAVAFNQAIGAHNEARLVAVIDADATTLLGGQTGRFDTATSYVPSPSPEQTDKLLARMALTAGIAQAEVLQLCFGGSEEMSAHGVPFGHIERHAA